MTEERCYICGRSAKELDVDSKSLRSPVFDWVIDKVQLQIKALEDLRQLTSDWLQSHDDTLMIKVKALAKADPGLIEKSAFGEIIPYSWRADEDIDLGWNRIGFYQRFESEKKRDQDFESVLVRVTNDIAVLKQALSSLEERRESQERPTIRLHHVRIPLGEIFDISKPLASVEENASEFDPKFSHNYSGRSLSLRSESYHYEESDALETALCDVCLWLSKKSPTDDGYYDDDRTYHDDGVTDFPAEDWNEAGNR